MTSLIPSLEYPNPSGHIPNHPPTRRRWWPERGTVGASSYRRGMTALESLLPAPAHVTIDGADIATYTLTPEQPARGEVVFCHGTPWSARVWADIAIHLSRTHRVLLWDMPGYGASPKDPAVSIDLAAQMSRFAQLLRHWQVDRPSVVAHDIGGAVTLGAHLLHSSDYTAVSLWDIVTLDPWGSPFFRLVADHANVFTQLPAPLHDALVHEYIAGAANHRLPSGTVDALADPWTGAVGQAAFYRQIAALTSDDTEPVARRLPEVRCPVTIGWGEEDPWIPVAQASQLRELLPGDDPVELVPGAGHLTPIEAPSQVLDAIRAWLGISADAR